MTPVPIIITNRDLLHIPRKLVADLQKLDGIGEITIVDCASTYPPLLDWYDTNPCRIARAANLGPHAPWNSGAVAQYAAHADYYIATDGDVDISECPLDLLHKMAEGLRLHPEAIKCSPSIRIDDLPESPFKQDVLNEQAGSWQLLPSGYYAAPCDNVFPMYRRGTTWGGYSPAVRTPPPYTLRHVPWYLWDKQPEDHLYYLAHLDHHGLLWSNVFNEKLKGVSVDRDVNGARGVFLRALGDTPLALVRQ